MAVSIVVGAQYGSEGKGKVAYFLAAERCARVAVRVGGANSGHTVHVGGESIALRQLPTASLLPDVTCVLAPGSYIDPDVLLAEVRRVGLGSDRLVIDPRATIVTEHDRAEEAGLNASIGSTQTGVGAAVARRARRAGGTVLARDCRALFPYLRDTTQLLRSAVSADAAVVVEGTQGFGLSVLHSDHYPMATSRDTTAAAVLSETGLSPFDVDEVVLVARSYPIRVAGNSGPLPGEITWEAVAREGGLCYDPAEYTTVTKRLRRVARFDPAVVRRAIAVNRPSRIVLNHADLIGDVETPAGYERVQRFLQSVEAQIDAPIDEVGLGPDVLVSRLELHGQAPKKSADQRGALAAT